MTHSLYRTGSYDEVKDDFVVLIMPGKGINVEGSAAKMKQFLDIANRHAPTDLGGWAIGHMYNSTLEDMKDKVIDRAASCSVVYDSKEFLVEFLKEMKEADLGLSLVISGVDEIVKNDVCKELDIKPHTTNYSLGIMGKTEKLPQDERVLAVATMCGHGMVSYNLINQAVAEVRGGADPEQVAAKLAQPCSCAIFNVRRAVGLLKEMSRDTLE